MLRTCNTWPNGQQVIFFCLFSHPSPCPFKGVQNRPNSHHTDNQTCLQCFAMCEMMNWPKKIIFNYNYIEIIYWKISYICNGGTPACILVRTVSLSKWSREQSLTENILCSWIIFGISLQNHPFKFNLITFSFISGHICLFKEVHSHNNYFKSILILNI